MKKLLLSIVLGLTIGFTSISQITRYFEFTTNCGYGNWQDTSFVAATSDQSVIDSVLADIVKPLNQRKFIIGKIDYGNGGYNHNASHWFLWHFILNQWHLAEFAVEVCDGCPYSSVDSDTAYWVRHLGYFCPWSGKPVKEISKPEKIHDLTFVNEITLYPNPASNKLNLKRNSLKSVSVTIYTTIGQEKTTFFLSKQNEVLDVSSLQTGIYFLRIKEKDKTEFEKLIIER